MRRGAIFLFWTWLAFFFATRDILTRQSLGFGNPWLKAAWWKAMEWYGWAILSVGIFYVCRKYYDPRKSWLRYALIHILSGTVFSLAHVAICTVGARLEAQALNTGLSWGYLFRVVFLNHFHFDWLVYAALVSVWHVIHSYRGIRDREVRAAELETRLARSQLQALKTQLQPHFLFNTLHSISVLNHQDPKAANRMLARLSNLLRLSLDKDSAQHVTLQEELDFLSNYVEIEKVRLGERLTVQMDIAPETCQANVPNLILQPLVENAIRYGIAPYSAPGTVTITSQRIDDQLRLEIKDTGPGFSTDNVQPGVGLSNTSDRLQRLYGKEGRLSFHQNGTGFSVIIQLPYQTRADTR